ncbi:hypothetical protein A1704_21040 [Chryseobacterium cucumeris]|nr:hypothetical protein A1704_21040 [Chryseobacterium cucumeris]
MNNFCKNTNVITVKKMMESFLAETVEFYVFLNCGCGKKVYLLIFSPTNYTDDIDDCIVFSIEAGFSPSSNHDKFPLASAKTYFFYPKDNVDFFEKRKITNFH